jgi:hypothetical protein
VIAKIVLEVNVPRELVNTFRDDGPPETQKELIARVSKWMQWKLEAAARDRIEDSTKEERPDVLSFGK